MNKIKTRHVRNSKRRGKHTMRKGYRKYKKHYTQKNVKRIQGQGKGQLRKQRHTRRKVGGFIADNTMLDEVPTIVAANTSDAKNIENQHAEAPQVEAEANAAAKEQTEPYSEAFLKAKADYEIQQENFNESLKPKPPQIVSQDNLTTEHIKFMLKKIEEYSKNKQTCLLLCDPDSCDENMLEKIKAKFIANAEDNNIDLDKINLEQNSGVLSDILDDSLLLILENLCKESSNFVFLMQNCSTRILQLFKKDDKLHSILKIFFMSIANNYSNPTTLPLCVTNMKKLLDLLNSMTPQNMQKLLGLLNFMTTQNMQKLLDLLNSMTRESISILLTGLQILEPQKITDMLNNYIKLNKNPNSMAQLLELYSFIERTPDGYFLVHRYPKGKTPLVQSGILRNKKHKLETCSSVAALDNQVRNIFNEGAVTFTEDKEFQNVLAECSQHPPSQQVSGGGRKRKTLKKKRSNNSRRKRMVK
jgi:hypothetical protein